LTLFYKGHVMAYRLLAEGEPPTPLDDEKSVQHRVDQAKQAQNARPAYKPAPDHPWRKSARFTEPSQHTT
jgi:hypothetical protein